MLRSILAAVGLVDNPPPDLTQNTVAYVRPTCPYRDPGDDVRRHGRLNGNVHLEVSAGKACIQGRGGRRRYLAEILQQGSSSARYVSTFYIIHVLAFCY